MKNENDQDEIKAALAQALGLLRKGDPRGASSLLSDILKHNPAHFDALRLKGIACHLMVNNQEAVRFLQGAISVDPDSSDIHYNLGVAQNALNQHAEAVVSFQHAIEINPDDAAVHDALGGTLAALKRHDEASTSFRRAIEIDKDFSEAHNNLGTALNALNHWSEAAESFQKAIKLNPRFTEAHINLGGVLNHLKNYGEAEKSLRQAISLQSNSAEAHSNLGVALGNLHRYEEARDCFDRAVEINPQHDIAFSQSALISRRICDWSQFAETRTELTRRVREDRSALSPFVFLTFSDDPADHLLCARYYAEFKAYSSKQNLFTVTPTKGEPIRIAYVSGDFREHPVAYQMAELFERHDRARFEIFGISMGRDDNSPIRSRLIEAFDQFIDVRTMGHQAVGQLLAEKQIHIAVDLNGYTAGARPEIFVQRPAPIQVNYLGYPCTMGADFMDYILVDPHIAPPDQQQNFSEQLVHLPDSYMVTDSKRTMPKNGPSRQDVGLPEEGFVFCCFHNSYKITAETFDIWMRLLNGVPKSVLWMRADNESAIQNLRKEATARGVDPDRIVLADRVDRADHLARHSLADLFLDTLPYNAHSSASDALWAGLPVLTCEGQAFAGRVGSSLLHAMGMPELITNSLEDYEAMALKLATTPELLEELCQKLARNRDTTPLFDAKRFCTHIEAAYKAMYDNWCEEKIPGSIKVDPGT
jgi:protein O-GlcNAc transferase